MRVGLIPLDERPVNTRYPALLAAIAGVELALPPAGALSAFRAPADCARLAGWTRTVAPTLDALIVSCEMLGYGGLIASRTTAEPAGAVVGRLDLLRGVKDRCPALPILGFNLIARVSNADDATEEPPYWAEYGRRLYRLSHLLDREARGEAVGADLDPLRAAIPPAHLRDWLGRRARNHTVNLAALQLLADGVFDLLVLSSDDTSPHGLGSREKGWLAEWAARLALGDRLLLYPGADEVGCALLARAFNARAGDPPRFTPRYAVPGGEAVVAPYEDGPVRVTVERQVRAVGGLLAADEAGTGAIRLAVNPPVPRRGEWHADHAAAERAARLPHLTALTAAIERWLAGGERVVVADVAYPNGADPALIDVLRDRLGDRLPALAAYGAWNTAGNTIGVALAQGCATTLIADERGRAAQERFLLHRFVEDWGYQQIARREPTAATLPATVAHVEARLNELIDALPGFAGRYRIAPGSVRLPWNRTFEVDFDLLSAERRVAPVQHPQ